jgi:hypothetical protein
MPSPDPENDFLAKSHDKFYCRRVSKHGNHMRGKSVFQPSQTINELTPEALIESKDPTAPSPSPHHLS